MQSHARVVHRTNERLRLRIPERRKDIVYFLGLYDELRQIPGVTEVSINPLTAGVLVHFHPSTAEQVIAALQRMEFLPQKNKETSVRGEPGPADGFFTNHESAASDVRTLLLTFMIGVAIHQALHGKILVPVFSALWYGYDLLAARKREKQTSNPPSAAK